MIMEYGGYNIDGDGAFGMKIIKTIGRGSLPSELRGSFSNEREARKAIDLSRALKENVNAEVLRTS
jgi:hypothetical protein